MRLVEHDGSNSSRGRLRTTMGAKKRGTVTFNKCCRILRLDVRGVGMPNLQLKGVGGIALHAKVFELRLKPFAPLRRL
jgi:hypothetical protein